MEHYPHGLPLPTLMTAQQQVQVTQANPTPSSRVQAKSPIYVVIAIQKITDPEAYKPLPEKGRAAAEAAGGHYLIRTGNITRLDGVTLNDLPSSNSIASRKRKLGIVHRPRKMLTQSDPNLRTRLRSLSRGSVNERLGTREKAFPPSE